jgi:hypothetical protein
MKVEFEGIEVEFERGEFSYSDSEERMAVYFANGWDKDGGLYEATWIEQCGEKRIEDIEKL